MNTDNFDIDLVYLWVDGSDPAWLAKKSAFSPQVTDNTDNNCKGRYANNDELKYSLRSVELYAPWIRKIFIITNDQKPVWLNTENPKIKIIDHKDILPQVSLPCFNSRIIESHIYKIPDLSERFLYANDDMFFNKPTQPNMFFAKDGFPVIRLEHKPFRRFQYFWRAKIRKRRMDAYRNTVEASLNLVMKKYGVYYNAKPHHNIEAYLKSDWQKLVEDVFKKEFETTFSNHVRTDNDIHRIIFSCAALAEKRGHLRYVLSRRESFHARICNQNHYKKIEKYNPLLFCVNDSEYATDNDRDVLKAWLNDRFPQKSAFEK